MLATQRVNEVHMNSREFSPWGPIIFFIRVYRVFHKPVKLTREKTHGYSYAMLTRCVASMVSPDGAMDSTPD